MVKASTKIKLSPKQGDLGNKSKQSRICSSRGTRLPSMGLLPTSQIHAQSSPKKLDHLESRSFEKPDGLIPEKRLKTQFIEVNVL